MILRPGRTYKFEIQDFGREGALVEQWPVPKAASPKSPGTTKHLELTDDEVRVLEFTVAQFAAGDARDQFSEPQGSALAKLQAFGLYTGRVPYCIDLQGVRYRARERSQVHPGLSKNACLILERA